MDITISQDLLLSITSPGILYLSIDDMILSVHKSKDDIPSTLKMHTHPDIFVDTLTQKKYKYYSKDIVNHILSMGQIRRPLISYTPLSRSTESTINVEDLTNLNLLVTIKQTSELVIRRVKIL